MAETITHSFVSAKTQSPDTTLVSKDEWNDGHVFSGGVNGQVLLYDNTQPNNMRWVDGATSGIVTVTISAATASPQNNVATLAFTTTSTVRLNLTVFIVTATTGSSTYSFNVELDGVSLIANTTVANVAQAIRFATTTANAGNHTLQLDVSTANNTNFDSGFIQMSTTRFGI